MFKVFKSQPYMQLLDGEAEPFLKALFLVIIVGVLGVIAVNIFMEMHKNPNCVYIGGVGHQRVLSNYCGPFR
jgi:hypothetical protein